MRAASMGLLVIGVIVLLVGLANHFVLKANPVAHTSTIVLAVGGVLAVIGVIMMAMGGKQAA
jgi:hypothetical protein